MSLTDKQRKYKILNKDKIAKYMKAYRLTHKEEKKIHDKKYRDSHKESIALYKKEYRKKNADKMAKQDSIYGKSYRKANRGKCNAKWAKYTCSKKNRTPAYANLKAIAKIYRTASVLSKMLKREFQVDHIIPLQGKNVSGLHVENNLQIISAERNHRKSNKFNTGMDFTFKINKCSWSNLCSINSGSI